MQRSPVARTGPDSRQDELQSWAVRLPALAFVSSSRPESGTSGETRKVHSSLGRLRLTAGIDVLVDGDDIWLRGETLDETLALVLRSLPLAERYLVAADGQLAAWGETVPRAVLPAGDWQPMARWLSLVLPTAAFAGVVQQRIPLKLVRSGEPVEANLLRTTWPVWRDYAVTAAQVRLNQWSFAVSDSGEVLVWGLPPPPLPGQRLVEAAGVAFPAGCRPDPPLAPESVRRVLNVAPDHLAVLAETGEVELIPNPVFVRATRSAVRLTDDSLYG